MADHMMGLSRGRRSAVERLPPGRILEVGAGTGKNIAHHSRGSLVVLTDLSPAMLRLAKRRASEAHADLRFVVTDVEALAFKDGIFDGLLATCVFCSVPDPARGLTEIQRVLKPEGRAVFLEHVRPPGIRGRLFDLLDPLASRLMGPHINRRTLETMRQVGLAFAEVRDVFSDWVKLVVAGPAPAGRPAR